MNIFNKNKVELVVIRNAINATADDIEFSTGDDLVELLQKAFRTSRLPEGTQIFYEGMLPENNVTPKNEADVKKLLKMRGRFYAVILPQGLGLVFLGVLALSTAVTVYFTMQYFKNMQDQGGAAGSQPSPNNSLSQRTNTQRHGARVADIVGEVWATPDLVAVPYSVYIDDQEVEFSTMCLGRGYYDVKKVRDGLTDIRQIRGASAQVYWPKTSIHNTPNFSFGNTPTDQENALSRLSVRRYQGINGQVLPLPSEYLTTNGNVTFVAPNIIRFTGYEGGATITGDLPWWGPLNLPFDLRRILGTKKRFKVGDTLLLEGVDAVKSSNSDTLYNLNGSYEIASINGTDIELVSPYYSNDGWMALHTDSATTEASSPTISAETQGLWTDWQYVTDPNALGIMFNVIAPAGIYVTNPTDANKVAPAWVDWIAQSQKIDENGDPIGDVTEHSGTVFWTKGYRGFTDDLDARRTIARTEKFYVPGRSRFRIRRGNSHREISNYGESQQIVDELKIKDFYSYNTLLNIGADISDDCTLLVTKTLGTEGALALKERKLNMRVQRWLNTPEGALKLSNQVDDIIYHLAVDPKIGGMKYSDIDTPQIRGETLSIKDYFNSAQPAEFGYTFDDKNLSSEQTLQCVAGAAFSQLYRYNNKLRMHFEQPQPVAVALFNSHNILPGTYQQKQSFGINKNYDGVIVKYVDPVDDVQVTLQSPKDKTLANPEEVVLTGVRNKRQAQIHASRMWHKHVFSYKSIEFSGADESNIVVPMQRVDVADQMRTGVLQGVVTDLIYEVGTGIVMTLSEYNDKSELNDFTLFVQLINGQVDYMPVQKLDGHRVLLPRYPIHTVSADMTAVVQATYTLVLASGDDERDAFIVNSKQAEEGFANRITAINYDTRYYQSDNVDVGEEGGRICEYYYDPITKTGGMRCVY